MLLIAKQKRAGVRGAGVGGKDKGREENGIKPTIVWLNRNNNFGLWKEAWW